MKTNSPKLLIEINKNKFIFSVVNKTGDIEFNLIHFSQTAIHGIKDDAIVNFDLVCNTLKENIFSIEKNLNCVFKEVIFIIDNFELSLISLSGYKKLNGSQLSKENVTYLLNSLKSKIQEYEKNKTILHIFNLEYLLDSKRVENLPIGLFGNFYSQELSFFLIDNNIKKNLKNIFDKCNLKLNKIISKSFIEGVKIINENKNFESFFKINIYEDFSRLILFQNAGLKYTQNFNFGTDLILKDIAKVTSLDIREVKNFLSSEDFQNSHLNADLIEEKYFQISKFRKIKKKLIQEIALSRIEEFSEKILLQNINVAIFIKTYPIILNIKDEICYQKLGGSFKSSFSKYNNCLMRILTEDKKTFINQTMKIVYFGWKKEAVPVVQPKKSVISRFFDIFFN